MTEGVKHTVLVVDDDEGIRRALGHWVLRLGYETHVAASAEAALTVLETTPIDVALCDVVMPGMNGLRLADRIRERFPSVAIVLATGLRDLDPSITRRPGVVAYVVKPFAHEEIATAIRQGLAWRERNVASIPAAMDGDHVLEDGLFGPLEGGRRQ